MDLTIQILTKNNELTIEKTLSSILPLNPKVQIIDLGSNDKTIAICEKYKIKVEKTLETDRSFIRNTYFEKANTKWFLYLNPWEAIVQGHDIIKSLTEGSYKFNIFEEKILNKETRLWSKALNYRFSNPIFETLNDKKSKLVNVIIYSSSKHVNEDKEKEVDQWRNKEPLSPYPYYYKGCLLLANKKYDEFLNLSEQYTILHPGIDISSIMNRYYFSMVYIYHKKKIRKALQNLAICLACHPLMAEFWCLAGDGYYHLMRDFDKAIAFYENAITLGNQRKLDDDWPMDISKYNEYPNKMIQSCKKIQNNLEKIIIRH